MNYLFFVLVFPNCFQQAKVEVRRLPEGHPQAGQDENRHPNHHTKLYFNTLRKNLQNRPISPKRKTPFRTSCSYKIPQKTSILKKRCSIKTFVPVVYPHFTRLNPARNPTKSLTQMSRILPIVTTNLRSFPIPHQASDHLTIFKTIYYGENPIFLPLPRRTIFPNDAMVTARKLETSGIAETTGPGIPGWESLNLSIKPSAEPSLLEICRGGERCAKANLSIKPSAEPSLLEICRGGERCAKANLSIKPSAEPSLLEICRGGERCAKANEGISKRQKS